jgi:hypothetical protein
MEFFPIEDDDHDNLRAVIVLLRAEGVEILDAKPDDNLS